MTLVAYTPDTEPTPRFVMAARIVSAAVGVAVLCAWAVLAAGHASDLFRINWVSGVWLALAQAAADGTLYPPVFDGEHFGGTRYMPLAILLTAGVDTVVGNTLLAAKLVTYGACVALGLLVFTVLGRERVAIGPRLLLLAAVAVSLPSVTLGVRGEVLPVLFQLAAVAVVARYESRRSAGVAGLLAGLALLAKLNAVWGLAAIVIWLVARQRRRLVPFGLGFLATVGIGVLVTTVISDGRFLDNVTEVVFLGSTSLGTTVRYATGIAGSPPWKLLVYLGAAGAVLVTLAIIRFAVAAGRRRLTVYDLCLPCVVATTLVTFLDAGTAENHVFDLLVVSAVCAGLLIGSSSPLDLADRRSLEVAVVVLLGWTTIVAFQSSFRQGAIDVIRGREDEYSTSSLQQLDSSGEILSEDATVPVVLGRRPVILDAYLFLRLGQRHPEWVAQLVERIDAHDFDRIFLTRRIDDSTRAWYEDANLGPDVLAAITRSYRYSEEVADLAVYIPKPRS